MKKALPILLALFLCAGAVGYYLRPVTTQPQSLGTAPAALGSPAVAVVTSSVRRGPANQRVESVATLLADESVVIRAEIDGRIGALDVQEGQPVDKDHVLVTLNPAEYRAEVDQREAGVALGELKFKRARDLLAKRVMSTQEYDEMDAALKAARAALALARARLNKTVLRAPFSGILGLRRISPGDYVKKGQDLVNLEAIDPIKIDLRIPERHAAQVRPSQRILVNVEAFPEAVFEGEIYAVDPRVDEASRSLRVRGRIPNQHLKLRPGMFARASLILSVREDALWVPEQALVPMASGQFVYRAVGGKAVLTQVTTGTRVPGEVEITAGLGLGDIVVTEGYAKLQDGVPIEATDWCDTRGAEPAAG